MRIGDLSLVSDGGKGGAYNGFDAPQHRIPIAHAPFILVYLLQPGVDRPCWPPTWSSIRNSSRSSSRSRGYLHTAGSLGRSTIGVEALYVFRVVRRSFQPCDQI